MTGFASGVVGRVDAQLLLVGPSIDGVADDPEGAEVLAECIATWESLPTDFRSSVRLVTLPMDDVDENAVMVNALQQSATVIVQKSLAEGLGSRWPKGCGRALLHRDAPHHVLVDVADVVVGPRLHGSFEHLGHFGADVTRVELTAGGSERMGDLVRVGHAH
jgi:hypothetical protein